MEDPHVTYIICKTISCCTDLKIPNIKQQNKRTEEQNKARDKNKNKKTRRKLKQKKKLFRS